MADLPISLVIFTYLSGISAGTFIFYTLYQVFFIKSKTPEENELANRFATLDFRVSVLSIVLLGIGLISSAFHLGHPFRFLNGLRNPASMIAQEGYWSIFFGILLLIVLILALRGKPASMVLNVFTSLVGLGLLIVTSLVYARTMGIPAWNNGVTPLFFIFSALIMGCIVLLLLLSLQSESIESIKKIVFVFLGMLLVQVFIEFTYQIQLGMGTHGVDLPNLLVLNITRSLIGLVAPLIIAILMFKKPIKIQTGIMLLFVSIILGEGISRIIFFMNGIHL